MIKRDEKSNLKAKTTAELQSLVVEAEKELVNLRMSQATTQGGNVKITKLLRKKIAVIKTYINQKK